MKISEFCESEYRKNLSDIQLLQLVWHLVIRSVGVYHQEEPPAYSPDDFEIDEEGRLTLLAPSGQADPLYEAPILNPGEDSFFYMRGMLAAQLLFGKSIMDHIDLPTVAVLSGEEPDSSLFLESDLLEKPLPGVADDLRHKLCSVISKLTSFSDRERDEGAAELAAYGAQLGCRYEILCVSADRSARKDVSLAVPYTHMYTNVWPEEKDRIIQLSDGRNYVFASTPLPFIPGVHTITLTAESMAPETAPPPEPAPESMLEPAPESLFELAPESTPEPAPEPAPDPTPGPVPTKRERLDPASVIGVDLGTETTCVVNADGEVLCIEDYSEYIPSALFYKSAANVEIGRIANERGRIYPRACVRGFKRQIGQSEQGGVIVTPDGERLSYTGSSTSACFVAELIQQLEDRQAERISHVVVTVPAMFDNAKKSETIRVLLNAGLREENIRIIEEPVAAACFYGCAPDGGYTAVFDLGGGTFDFTLLNGNRVIGKNGNLHVGGLDFTKALIQIFLRKAAANGLVLPSRSDNMDVNTGKMYYNLYERAENAKKALSENDLTDISLDVIASGRPVPLSVTVSREEFEQEIAHFLEDIRASVRQGLGDCGLQAEAIDRVIIVGGSTLIPCVDHMIRSELFSSCRTFMATDRMCAVARGAAAYAGQFWLDDQLLVTNDRDITTTQEKDLGILTADREFVCIVERLTPFRNGVSKRKEFSFLTSAPDRIVVPLYTRAPNCTDTRLPFWSNAQPRKFTKIGSLVFKNVPGENMLRNKLDVEIGIDENGAVYGKGIILDPDNGQTLASVEAALRF